jgi:hypothetical protein
MTNQEIFGPLLEDKTYQAAKDHIIWLTLAANEIDLDAGPSLAAFLHDVVLAAEELDKKNELDLAKTNDLVYLDYLTDHFEQYTYLLAGCLSRNQSMKTNWFDSDFVLNCISETIINLIRNAADLQAQKAVKEALINKHDLMDLTRD